MIYKDCHFFCVFFYRVTLLKLITDCWFNTLLVLLIDFLFFYYRLINFRPFFFRPPDSKSEKNFP